jgi:hypothetical protein
LAALLRKTWQVLNDPILRKWLLGRALGRWQKRPFHRLHPPYLNSKNLSLNNIIGEKFTRLINATPEQPLHLNLSGEIVTIQPGEQHQLMTRSFADTESLLALHRFAWIPALGRECDPNWVNALWHAWVDVHGKPNTTSWAWHPYTTSERLINILTFAERSGLPGPTNETLETLNQHGPEIFQNLEYFGEFNTGNHLANNGRGLFLGGLGLGKSDWVEQGEKILIREAERLFSPSGILNEGSSHYHLLVTRWYAECWLAAQLSERASAHQLATIVERALSVLPVFDMPGGLPLFGDVSPDCSPKYLSGLVTGERTGWLATLSNENFSALCKIREGASFDRKQAAEDGWRQKQVDKWCANFHISQKGWSEQPGHAHQDLGSFELHFGNLPILIDRGRRSYNQTGDEDVTTQAHNSIRIDGQGPYPKNRPYYNDSFRELVCGEFPIVGETKDSLNIETSSFSRIKNVGTWKRQWKFGKNEILITDHIEGKGHHTIERFLHTTLPVTTYDEYINIGAFRLSGDNRAKTWSSENWPSYGENEPATSICFTNGIDLPWTGTMKLELNP